MPPEYATGDISKFVEYHLKISLNHMSINNRLILSKNISCVLFRILFKIGFVVKSYILTIVIVSKMKFKQ